MFNKHILNYPPAGTNETPFNNNRTEYDVICGEVYKEKTCWKYTAIMSLVFLGLSLLGWVWAVSLPDTAYHVIEIAPWGEAKSIGKTGKTAYTDIQRPEQSIKYYLTSFIRNIRTVSTDKYMIRDNLQTAFCFVTLAGANILQNLAREHSLFLRADSERVEIVIESILAVSKDAYQVDWYERIFTKDGNYQTQEQYRGIFNLYCTTPDEKQSVKNPLGIFVDEFSIQQIRVIK